MAKPPRAGSASFTEAVQPRSAQHGAETHAGGDPGGGAGDGTEPLDAAIERVLAELGGDADASINVYAIRPGSRSGEFVDSFPADAFAGEASFLKRIRDEFGPGEYRIQLRDGTRFLVNRLVRIAPARERPRGDDAAAGIVAALSAVLEQSAKRTEDLVRAIVAARPADTEDQVLARLRTLREVFGPIGGGGRGAGTDAIQVFLQGLSLGRTLEPHGGAGTSDVLLETVKTLGPALVRAVQAGQPPRLEQPRPPARPAPGAAAAAAAPAGVATAEGDAMTPALRKLLDQLLEAAARDADPGLYAEVTLDQVGLEHVRALFTAGDPVTLLSTIEPRVQQHVEWFTDLQTALHQLVTDDATTSAANAPPAGPGGGDDNAASHANAGA